MKIFLASSPSSTGFWSEKDTIYIIRSMYTLGFSLVES